MPRLGHGSDVIDRLLAADVNGRKGFDLLKTLAGLSAVIVLSPVLAHAEPIARWGQTVYPAKIAPAPEAPPATLVAEVQSEPKHVRGRHAWRHNRHAQQVVSSTPVETQPAPTPAAEKATTTQVPASGPHEEPAPTIRDLVTRHARENGVPEKLASAVVGIESRFNPKARGGSALGLMQIQYATARANGFSGNARGLLEPETNLHFGMKVLADAYKSSHGDLCLTLAKYQSGHLTTRLSAANRSYCARARAIMAKI